jgi:hypothetical protein
MNASIETKFTMILASVFTALTMCVVVAQGQSEGTKKPAATPVTGASTTEEATNPQAPGGGHGQVWVNTEAGVYHREGSPFYGTTRKGKYMTEQDAIQAGYKPAPKGP